MTNKIILGTVQFGLNYGINNNCGKPEVSQVFKMLEIAAESGIEILDTADAYGNASEILGEFNKLHPGYFKINTKFKAEQGPVDLQLVKSFEHLSVSTINTYFFHSFSDFKNNPNLLIELGQLKEKGSIQKIGVSVYGNDEFEMAFNTKEVDVIQFPFNLLDNRFQRGRLISQAKAKGKELQIRSVFLQGLFFKPIEDIMAKLTPLKPYLKILFELANEYNFAIENLALLYAFSQPEVDYVIIGVDNQVQLKKNLIALQQNISLEIIEIINKIAVRETELLYPKNWK